MCAMSAPAAVAAIDLDNKVKPMKKGCMKIPATFSGYIFSEKNKKFRNRIDIFTV